YSTKGENRGLGLNNVRKILANYGTMFLETELQGNRFLQVLKIGGYEQE
ncbi:MAG: GHKL domain-containing protein, partial [Streptococcus sp.]